MQHIKMLRLAIWSDLRIKVLTLMQKGKILSHYLKYGFAQDISYVKSPHIELQKCGKIEDLQAQVINRFIFILEF
jgi:hypothetical protein